MKKKTVDHPQPRGMNHHEGWNTSTTSTMHPRTTRHTKNTKRTMDDDSLDWGLKSYFLSIGTQLHQKFKHFSSTSKTTSQALWVTKKKHLSNTTPTFLDEEQEENRREEQE
ncbi:hypothetical protein HMI55_003160, partial [Coelomomyces lativittatus]